MRRVGVVGETRFLPERQQFRDQLQMRLDASSDVRFAAPDMRDCRECGDELRHLFGTWIECPYSCTARPRKPSRTALSESPYFNAQLRMTCVATQLAAGHAENALPQHATATVNCRILPVETPAEMRRLLERVIGDPEIIITEMNEPIAAPYKPIDSRVTETLEAAARKVFPGIPVVPLMSTGTSDSTYLLQAGIPSYSAGGIFWDDFRAHGRDERILVQSFDDGADFLWEAVTLFGKLP